MFPELHVAVTNSRITVEANNQHVAEVQALSASQSREPLLLVVVGDELVSGGPR